MKTIGYVRVSTEGQALDGVSLDAQRTRIESWTKATGGILLAVYEDAGISGSKTENRAGLIAALDHVEGVKGILVVYGLSRLSRSTKDTIAIAERLDRAGADLVSLSERIDTTSASGKMVFRMLAVLNEFERDQIAERTKAALAHKRSRGEWTGGGVPYGYTLDSDSKSLIVEPVEQDVIARVHDERGAGRSLRHIAASLNRDGIRTKEGRDWKAAQIQSVLRRRHM